MTASYGTQPRYTKHQEVSGEPSLKHNEYYLVEGQKTDFVWSYGMDTAAKEREIIEEAKKQYATQPEVTLIYAEATISDKGLPGFFYDVHTKYIIKSNHPIAPALVIAIAVAIVLIVVAISIVVWVFYITVSALGGNLFAMIIIIIVAVVIIYIFTKGKVKVGKVKIG